MMTTTTKTAMAFMLLIAIWTCCSTVGVSAGPSGPQGCEDRNSQCAALVKSGYCTNRPRFMLVNCKKSCNKCDGGGGGKGTICKDESSRCAIYPIGYCNTYPEYMLLNCKKSCNSCKSNTPSETCVDGNGNCASWAKIGECAKNSNYMKVNCKKSCRQCSSTANSDLSFAMS